jgi:Domain of unknown function (DUF4412)
MQTSKMFTLAILAAPVAAIAASDDLTIISSNSYNGKPTATSTSYLASDHVRMARAEGNETIVDVKTGVMTTLDGKKKTYYTTTKRDLEQFAAKMQERMNSPEMKKGMEMMQKMAGAMASSYDVKKTGVSRKVAGYSCEEWTITIGAMSTTHECVTSELQYPAHAFDAYKEVAQSMQSAMSSMSPMGNAGADLAEKLRSMKGFPVATSSVIDIMGNKTVTESQVIEVRRGAIPASAWEIPAGYKQIDNPMLKALDRGSHASPTG